MRARVYSLILKKVQKKCGAPGRTPLEGRKGVGAYFAGEANLASPNRT
jgi:hypothetical protein